MQLNLSDNECPAAIQRPLHLWLVKTDTALPKTTGSRIVFIQRSTTTWPFPKYAACWMQAGKNRTNPHRDNLYAWASSHENHWPNNTRSASKSFTAENYSCVTPTATLHQFLGHASMYTHRKPPEMQNDISSFTDHIRLTNSTILYLKYLCANFMHVLIILMGLLITAC